MLKMPCNAVMLLLLIIGLSGLKSANCYAPLCTAVEKGDLGTVQALVEGGADVNAVCSSSGPNRPIHVAARLGEVNIGKWLLSNGADINQSGYLGYTPLLQSGASLQPEFMEMLLQNGANVNGDDVLTVATDTYISWYKIAKSSTFRRTVLNQKYAVILNVLTEYCFDYKTYGPASATSLENTGHDDEAARVSELAENGAPGC